MTKRRADGNDVEEVSKQNKDRDDRSGDKATNEESLISQVFL
jgi:hypothetical protein